MIIDFIWKPSYCIVFSYYLWLFNNYFSFTFMYIVHVDEKSPDR